MQIVLLLILSGISSLLSVLLTQTLRTEKRSHRKKIGLFIVGLCLNLPSSVVMEGIMKAGRPTFYYHTHTPGMVTLKLFGMGCGLAFLSFSLLICLAERKQARRNGFPWFSRSVLIALLCASLMELFVFNMRHYELMGQDKPRIEFPVTNYWLHGFYYNRASQRVTAYPQSSNFFGFTAYFSFKKVRNLSFDGFDDDQPRTRVNISYIDRSHVYPLDIPQHQFIKGIPRSYNVPLHTVGDSYYVEVQFPDAYAEGDRLYNFALPGITINRTVPLELSFSRFALSFLLILILCSFWPASPLYRLKLDPRSPLQITLIILLIGASFTWFGWCAFSSYSGSEKSISEQKSAFTQNHLQYNRLIEALLSRHYALSEAPDKDLLQLDDPYDMQLREKSGVGYPWDTALYQGRYYVYFGVVPALSVLLPYYWLTGTFLELDYAILFFCCLGILGFYGLYSRITRRYFPQLPFGIYLLGFMMLICLSGLSWCLRRGLVYELAVTSAFCFAVWAVFLTFAAFDTQRFSGLLLFGAGLAAALAVGCRPTMLVISLVVFSVLFRQMKERGAFFSRRNILEGLLFLFPYVLVGLALMKYNYERFDTPFEFGITWQLTSANEATGFPRSSLWSVFISMISYLFTFPKANMNFPFIHAVKPDLPYNGFLLQEDVIIGLFAYPLVWFMVLLPAFRKTQTMKSPVLRTFRNSALLSALLLCLISSYFSITCRYLVDFAWLVGLCAVISLFCCYDCFRMKGLETWVQSAALICFGIGLTLFVSLSLTGEETWFQNLNPLYFDQLRYAYSFWL